ncbi:hypothetical protein, partial [Vibrio vulnificus]|uniref:hypothetical protein n=1 Tax=Vibrio vulnificus TaxID=672 RepID=UPI003ED8801C
MKDKLSFHGFARSKKLSTQWVIRTWIREKNRRRNKQQRKRPGRAPAEEGCLWNIVVPKIGAFVPG